MRTPLRRSGQALTALLAIAALTPGLFAPAAASAGAGARAERAVQRAERAAERVSRREARERERAERRETRERERTERRQARHAGAGPPASTAPSGASTANCRATIQASSNWITAGETVSVFGKVTCPGSESAAGMPLAVDQAQQGAGASAAAATPLGAARVAADGSYQLTALTLDSSTVFRVRLGDRGARTVVKVAPAVTLAGPPPATKLSTRGGRHAGGPARVTFTGTVTPAVAGTIVSLQVSDAGDAQWRTVALGRIDEGGSYSLAHSFKTPGQSAVRVVAHMHGRNVNGVSETLLYQVVQAQNPALTIAVGPSPVPYGQPVTVSGVALGAPGQTITLLQRTPAGAFAPLATTTSGTGGEYSFTQTLTRDTALQVGDATTHSSVAFVLVQRALTLEAPPTSAPAGAPLTLTGKIAPATDGETAYLERENASATGFHVVAAGTVTGGAFSIAHAFSGAGPCVLRVRVPGDASFQSTASAPFTVELVTALSATPPPQVAPTSEAPPAPGG
jgi:hypothetical protein